MKETKPDYPPSTVREIQEILLPHHHPAPRGYSIFGRNLPAQEISGDYFDIFTLSPQRTAITIADVSGKGISTSLLMATCRSALRSCAPLHSSTKETLCHLNRLLYPDIKEGTFITMIYAILDSSTHTLEISRAGHEIPLLLSTQHSPPHLTSIKESRGLALGLDSGETFDALLTPTTIHLQPGDTFVAFTDGLNEAFNPHQEQFGLTRLKEALITHASADLEKLCSLILHAVKNHVSTTSFHDDITLLLLRRELN
ncbi:MAG: serine/threonine-protein phosphatase [Methylacidiphilales bacterium]|nr:serine/threonine-protein phosphatase [Candidatus Methylacidiphilales bacterium]MDW8349435.1 PP2C family protein-serine/threonine phosphatase [Verrucomicrobiae bacterium]